MGPVSIADQIAEHLRLTSPVPAFIPSDELLERLKARESARLHTIAVSHETFPTGKIHAHGRD